MTRICAWCKRTLGETNGGGEGITHGICQSCMAAVFAGVDGDADEAPMVGGTEPIFERYVPANEGWGTAPEWRPIECDERDEPDWIADADVRELEAEYAAPATYERREYSAF